MLTTILALLRMMSRHPSMLSLNRKDFRQIKTTYPLFNPNIRPGMNPKTAATGKPVASTVLNMLQIVMLYYLAHE